MSHGMLGTQEVNQYFQKACHRYGEDELLRKPCGRVLVEFVPVINVTLFKTHLEIQKAFDEFNGEYYYVLVRT